MKESLTLAQVLRGRSLARFGDGELKLCHGRDSLTQVWSKEIQAELRTILWRSSCLVGIPHTLGLRPDYWTGFLKRHSTYMNPDVQYGSAFISRPDEAVLDKRFFRRLARLWAGKHVLLVTGGGSLTVEHLKDAASVHVIDAPERDAYAEVGRLEDECTKSGLTLVLLCLGAAGTILADRLTVKGVQAVDLGFIGKFL